MQRKVKVVRRQVVVASGVDERVRVGKEQRVKVVNGFRRAGGEGISAIDGAQRWIKWIRVPLEGYPAKGVDRVEGDAVRRPIKKVLSNRAGPVI